MAPSAVDNAHTGDLHRDYRMFTFPSNGFNGFTDIQSNS